MKDFITLDTFEDLLGVNLLKCIITLDTFEDPLRENLLYGFVELNIFEDPLLVDPSSFSCASEYFLF